MQGDRRRIWLIRHGNRLDFVNPAWCRTAARPYDAPLSPDGRVQAEEVAQRLAGEPVDQLFASPFQRTLETARPIARRLGLPIRVEPGLQEMLLGRWFPERPTFPAPAARRREFPEIDPSYRARVTPRYPETEAAAIRRAAKTARELVEAFPGNLAVVAHGGAITGLAQGLLNAAPHVHPTLCCLIVLAWHDDRWVLEADGRDTSYLSHSEERVRLN